MESGKQSSNIITTTLSSERRLLSEARELPRALCANQDRKRLKKSDKHHVVGSWCLRSDFHGFPPCVLMD
eukprot:2231132-Amphidinium_carterae.1